MNIEPQTSTDRRTSGHWLARSVLGVLAAGMVLSVSSGAQETNAYPPLSSFKIIQQRNIFNPYRTGIGRPEGPRSRQPQRVADAFALTGTMSYSKGRFAFFNGQSSQYKKVLESGGNIAGYTVKEVTQDAVTLAASGKEFQMPVGAQMRKVDNKWQLSGHVIEEAATDETNGETAAVESSAPPVGGSPQQSDVLKRLMEKRQQELK